MSEFFRKHLTRNLFMKALLVSAFISTNTWKVAAAKPGTDNEDAIKQELVSIALASIQAENDTLAFGDSDAAIKKNPQARKALKKLTKKLNQQKEKRDFLAKKKLSSKAQRQI